MNKVSQDDLQTLMNFDGDWCVSIFMSTHRAGQETRQDPIRFKNLLRLAEQSMANRGIVNGSADTHLQPAQNLIRDHEFWQHQSDGLAVFIGDGFFQTYRVPFHFAENVVVDSAFHLIPLLPVYYGDGRFYLLSLSQKAVRVFLCTRDDVQPIDVVGVPNSMEDYMKYIDPSATNHNRPGVPRGGGEPVAYNAHGLGNEEDKQRIQEFFRQVDDGLHDLLKEEEVPLVLACVDYLFPIYREVNSYRHLAADHIKGNPDTVKPGELHGKAWDLLKPLIDQRHKQSVERYLELEESEKSSRHLRDVVLAAMGGRIDELLVARDQEIWGEFDAGSGQAKETRKRQPDDQELRNISATLTLKNGGIVHTLSSEEMPHGLPMAAIFRY